MSAPPVRNPRLAPHARPFRRPDGTVQLGLDDGVGVRVTGLRAREAAWLASLDGTAERERALRRLAPDRRPHVARLLDDLADRGLVLDGPAPGEAPSPLAHVVLVGHGRIAGALAHALAGAGVARVERSPAAIEVIRDRLRGGSTDEDVDRPGLAVVVGAWPIGPERLRPWEAVGVPVVPVVGCGPAVDVGPLLLGGEGPCGACLELHRADVDPGWPWVRAQLDGSAGPAPTPAPVLAHLAAALVAGLVEPGAARAAAGRSWTVRLPGPATTVRRWPRHERCTAHPGGPVVVPSDAGSAPALDLLPASRVMMEA
ncbi:hypothetical protein [Janibacter massiliensis]|uniref:hypothetical protein n=1 Tax=Janibacter massiliensis TaxID=2058291 RepID=UPI000D0EAC69|nr:hypothetical protein [Janibacter massiliensis]